MNLWKSLLYNLTGKHKCMFRQIDVMNTKKTPKCVYCKKPLPDKLS